MRVVLQQCKQGLLLTNGGLATAIMLECEMACRSVLYTGYNTYFKTSDLFGK